jgi:twitching motility protein PilT
MSASDNLERRESTRKNIYVPIVCHEIVSGSPTSPNVQTVVHDLSEIGLSFKSKVIYSINTLLQAEIYLPTQKLPITPMIKVERVDSVVSAEQDQYMIGSVFSALTPEEKNAILECLENIDLYKILDHAKKIEASDVHLTVGQPAVFRTRGKLSYMESNPIQDGQVRAMLYPILNNTQIKNFETNKELNFAFSPSLDSRYRVNLHVQKGFLEAALRNIPVNALTFKQLGLPEPQLQRFCQEKAGLVLISGKTGSGKTTTLTTMIDYVNRNLQKVLVTVEDPIEYIHKSDKSIIKQREIGSDTKSYGEALKHTLRQDPDIVVVSELLDGESVLSALRAAETGHLVISTIHAPDTAQTIERILNFFPPEHANGICQQLSSVLLGILFQMLIPDKKGELVAASELLISNSAIRTSIREGRFSQIGFTIQTGSNLGMYTLETSLTRLKENDIIDDNVIQEFTRLA